MNNLLHIYNSVNSNNRKEEEIIDILKTFLVPKPKPKDLFETSLLAYFQSDKKINYIGIIELIGLLHQKKKEKNKLANTNERKHHGIYYTKYEIAELITKEALSSYKNGINLTELKYLEPCSGTGIFVIAYIDYIFGRKKVVDQNDTQKVINNIYCADIDEEAISLVKEIILLYVWAKYKKKVTLNANNFYTGDVLFETNGSTINKNSLKKVFGQEKGFDVITTNPPYKLLKANSNKYESNGANSYSERVKNIVSFIRKNGAYKYNQGTLNLYKLFVEDIVENYSHNQSKIGLLIPLTLLNDKQSYKLRHRIINNYSLSTIYVIPEKNDFFSEISQAFCFFSLDKASRPKTIRINPQVVNDNDFNNQTTIVEFEEIKKISDSEEIVIEKKQGLKILSKIHKNPKLKNIASLKNLRGELDLTLHKSFITKKKTKYPLMRGNSISKFRYRLNSNFVKTQILAQINSKRKYIDQERIVCQQISNIHAVKRLKFAKVPNNIILANSCNFIALNNETLFQNNNLSLNYLLGLLNSLLLNWRFKLTSSNNHVANYEIDELPIVIPNKKQQAIIEQITQAILSKPNNIMNLIKLNLEIFKIYKLGQNEILFVLDSYKESKLIKLIKKLVKSHDL